MQELPPALVEDIRRLSAEGDVLARSSKYQEAVAVYTKAWELIPDPKNDWEASTWVVAAIGDACFLEGFYTSAFEAFDFALHCPGGFGNPFIHLRLGQCELERKNLELAKEHLTRAYALEGAAIFSTESPKYFEFLKTQIQPPASGRW